MENDVSGKPLLPVSYCVFATGIAIGTALTLFMRFYLIRSIYTQRNHKLTFPQNDKLCYLFSLGCLVIAILMFPLLVGTLFVFGIYRTGTHFILGKKYGNRFGGLLSGADVMFQVEDQSKSISNTILIVEQNEYPTKSLFDDVTDSLAEQLATGILKDSKVSSTVQKELGYAFLIKNNVNASDIVREFDIEDSNRETISHEELQTKLCEVGNLPLPKNHSAFWEILVSKKPINWYKSRDSKKKYYPIICRIHHSLGDGVSCLKLISKCFKNDGVEGFKNFNTTSRRTAADFHSWQHQKNKINSLIHNLKRILQRTIQIGLQQSKLLLFHLSAMMFIPLLFAIELFGQTPEQNIFHGPELSGNKAFYWKTEEGKELLETVKNIKRRVPGSSFSDIIFTAISASLHEYMEKKSERVPEFMTVASPLNLDMNDKLNSCSDRLVFINNFTFGSFSLPLKMPNQFRHFENRISLIPRLKETMRQTHLLKQSADLQVTQWLLTVVNTLFPVSLLRSVYNFRRISVGVSNLPGIEAEKLFSGYSLKDIVFWVINMGYIGFGISCLTYDSRLQMGIIIDRALDPGKDNLQEILDNVWKYLRILDKETALGIPL